MKHFLSLIKSEMKSCWGKTLTRIDRHFDEFLVSIESDVIARSCGKAPLSTTSREEKGVLRGEKNAVCLYGKVVIEMIVRPTVCCDSSGKTAVQQYTSKLVPGTTLHKSSLQDVCCSCAENWKSKEYCQSHLSRLLIHC